MPLFKDDGLCEVDREDRSDVVPSEAINEGGEEGNRSWNGFD